MTSDDIRQQIELSVVDLIQKQMAAGTMTEDRAQEISQYILDTLKPGMSFEDLHKIIPKLDDRFSELAPIVLPFAKQYEEQIVKKAQQGVSDLIRQGQFDAATKLATDAINQDVKLEWTGKGKADIL